MNRLDSWNLVTLCYVSQSGNGTTCRPWFKASVQNKIADDNNILRPVSTFSKKFWLFMFESATSAKTCVAEPLKWISAKSLSVILRFKPGIHVIASMVRWVTKPTCERVWYSFIVACLKYRTNFFKKFLIISVLSTKDPGSQRVLCTLKPFRLCIIVLMFVPLIDFANSELNSSCLGWRDVFEGWFPLVFIRVSTIICRKTLIFIRDH